VHRQSQTRGALGPWRGRIFLSVGRAVYLGPAGDTTPHAHHALQVSIGLDAPIRLRQRGARWRQYDGAVVAPDLPHQLDGGWGDVLLFYLEPESTDGRRWLGATRGDIHSLAEETVAALRSAARRLGGQPPTDSILGRVHADLLEGLGLAPAQGPFDPRVAQALEQIRVTQHPASSLGELARAVGLSPSRFRHLFRREVGMSAQSYTVWLRIYEACQAVARGRSLSRAALEAGFSDAAHFTRTFRRTFGLAPSQVARALTVIAVPPAPSRDLKENSAVP
jgi:AraC-like DNA-binding protein